MRSYEWREALKPGDKVIVMPSSLSFALPRVATVEKVTRFHLLLVGDRRKWHRAKYHYVGHTGFGGDDLAEATPELLEKVAHLQRAERLSRVVWSGESPDLTARVCALLDAKEADRG